MSADKRKEGKEGIDVAIYSHKLTPENLAERFRQLIQDMCMADAEFEEKYTAILMELKKLGYAALVQVEPIRSDRLSERDVEWLKEMKISA